MVFKVEGTPDGSRGVPCPECNGGFSRIIESRQTGRMKKFGEDVSFRRRRVCSDCGHRYSTIELTCASIDRILDDQDLSEEVIALTWLSKRIGPNACITLADITYADQEDDAA